MATPRLGSGGLQLVHRDRDVTDQLPGSNPGQVAGIRLLVVLGVAVLGAAGCFGGELNARDAQTLCRDIPSIVKECQRPAPRQRQLEARVARVVAIAKAHPHDSFIRGQEFESATPVDHLAYITEVLAGLDATPVCSMPLAREADIALIEIGEDSVLRAAQARVRADSDLPATSWYSLDEASRAALPR